jgi:bacillithiol biosynthesis cysteine-adding enzyme BshC
MHISKVSFDKIQALSFKDVFYQQNYLQLKEFINFEPTLHGLAEAMETRKEFPVDRDLLVKVLADHYAAYQTSEKQYQNIYKLKEAETYTITTAHQPCLAGGPAYYFYKIFSVIHLARKLNIQYPDKHFVPVFINGSEDHDFEEVKSLQLFGKTITWHTEQKGPVGRFSVEGLDQVVAEMGEIFGKNPVANKIIDHFENALKSSKSYNEFVFQWINDFFKEHGLIVLNMDDARLKLAFKPIIEKEITQRISETLVNETQVRLGKFGFKSQAFARDINLFYIDGTSRERLYFDNGNYRINNADQIYSETEILKLLNDHPERFSPNVVLRPLYEEFILPNIAYIGGGGELAYWLERKKQFEAFGIFYPVLIRRNSVLMISKSVKKLMDKLHLSEEDLLLSDDKLVTRYLEKTSAEDFHLNQEIEKLKEIYLGIAEKAKNIDATLEPLVMGESAKLTKTIEGIESRLKRSLKHKEETTINKLKSLKNKLFPNNGLQERVESYLQFLTSEEEGLTDELIKNLDPLERDFLFIYL